MLRACAGKDPVKELCEINPTIIMFLLRFWLRGEHPEISFPTRFYRALPTFQLT